jgi:hypothetical protein
MGRMPVPSGEQAGTGESDRGRSWRGPGCGGVCTSGAPIRAAGRWREPAGEVLGHSGFHRDGRPGWPPYVQAHRTATSRDHRIRG